MSIHVFLHSHYADWEIAYLLPELVEQKRRVTTFALTKNPVKSLGGLTVVPDKAFADLDRASIQALILPGGDFWPTFEHAGLCDLICDVAAERKPIAGICAATTYMARIGLLDRVKHTSNDLTYLKTVVPDYRAERLYQQQLAVADGDVITASGLGAVEFTYEVLKKLKIYDAGECDRWFKAYKHGSFSAQM